MSSPISKIGFIKRHFHEKYPTMFQYFSFFLPGQGGLREACAAVLHQFHNRVHFYRIMMIDP